jgi:hypothetical protein
LPNVLGCAGVTGGGVVIGVVVAGDVIFLAIILVEMAASEKFRKKHRQISLNETR